MHYVRFLKPPKVQGGGAERRLTALCTVTTDLGDDFMPTDADLEISLNANDVSSGLLGNQTIQWRAGMRALPLEMRIAPSAAGLCFLEVKPSDGSSACPEYVGEAGERLRMPTIVPARSVLVIPPQGNAEADRMVLRSIDLDQYGVLKVWEESGESIARHIWDAGFALATFLSRADLLAQSMPVLAYLLTPDKLSRLSVIELGAGTGLVSLALSRILSKAQVLATDLLEVKELMARNIAANLASARAIVNFRALDWDAELPTVLLDAHQDLVVAADVTYNSDSSPALVRTITALAAGSPMLKVLVAMKKRHQSEDVFFQLMTKAGWTAEEHTTVLLPSAIDTGDMDIADEAHVYLFSQHR